MGDSLKKVFLPKKLENKMINIMIYSWVESDISKMPNVSIESSILSFYKRFGLDEDYYSVDSAKREYHRSKKEMNGIS